MDVQSVFLLGRHVVKFATTNVNEPGVASLRFQMGSTVLLATVSTRAHDNTEHVSLSLSLEYAGGFTHAPASSRKMLSHDREAILLDFVARSIRPLIHPGAPYDINVVIRVQSLDPEGEPEVAALLAVSAALCIANVPIRGTIAAVYIGYVDGQFVLNPSEAQTQQSRLHLAVTGTELSVMTVQGNASELGEDVILDAIIFGYKNVQAAIGAIEDFARNLKKSTCTWRPRERNSLLDGSLSETVKNALEEAYQIPEPQLRDEKIEALLEEVVSAYCTNATSTCELGFILKLFNAIEKKVIRQRVLNGLFRVDGRASGEVRPIRAELGPMQKPPGSALFVRGKSSILATASLLATNEEAAPLDSQRDSRERLTIHCSIQPVLSRHPPSLAYSRYREIEAGMLMKNAIEPVMPDKGSYPHPVQVFSDISDFESATLMASVGAVSLALMNAGIPIKKPVAGVAMGLVTEGSRFVILSDVLSEEELIADMALNVAGTKDGITALQMDIKVHGLSLTLIQAALRHAGKARLEMLECIGRHVEQYDAVDTQLVPEEVGSAASGNGLSATASPSSEKEAYTRCTAVLRRPASRHRARRQ
jgi:polyribonucleotide nucleotidyltransferase